MRTCRTCRGGADLVKRTKLRAIVSIDTLHEGSNDLSDSRAAISPRFYSPRANISCIILVIRIVTTLLSACRPFPSPLLSSIALRLLARCRITARVSARVGRT